MIVSVEEIRDEGLSLERDLSEEYLAKVLGEEGRDTGFRPRASAKLAARFEKVSGKLLLKASASVKVVSPCRRCLAEVEGEVPVEFTLSLVPGREDRPAGAGEEEPEPKDLEGTSASFDLGAVDEELYEGRQIDLGKIVREQVLLALPMDLLCSDECKGLCTVCGQDLNKKECGCDRKVTDPRWAALKSIKLN